MNNRSRSTNLAKSDGALEESTDLLAVVKAFVEWTREKPANSRKLLDLLKRAGMAIENPEGRSRAIRFESWDLTQPPVYFATEKKAFDWIEQRGWILRSKCWSYCRDEPEARIAVYVSEDDMNYGDVFEGHLIRPVAAFRALTRGLARPSRREHGAS